MTNNQFLMSLPIALKFSFKGKFTSASFFHSSWPLRHAVHILMPGRLSATESLLSNLKAEKKGKKKKKGLPSALKMGHKAYCIFSLFLNI